MCPQAIATSFHVNQINSQPISDWFKILYDYSCLDDMSYKEISVWHEREVLTVSQGKGKSLQHCWWGLFFCFRPSFFHLHSQSGKVWTQLTCHCEALHLFTVVYPAPAQAPSLALLSFQMEEEIWKHSQQPFFFCPPTHMWSALVLLTTVQLLL